MSQQLIIPKNNIYYGMKHIKRDVFVALGQSEIQFTKNLDFWLSGEHVYYANTWKDFSMEGWQAMRMKIEETI